MIPRVLAMAVHTNPIYGLLMTSDYQQTVHKDSENSGDLVNLKDVLACPGANLAIASHRSLSP